MSVPKLVDALASAQVLFDRATLEAAIERIAEDIAQAYVEGEVPVFLTVMNGGLPFAAQLAFALGERGLDLEFDYLHATRYGPETQGGKISWRTAPWTSVKGRSVLVVDDILDEGVTLAAVKESLKRMGAAEVLTAVFADKLNGKQKPVAADFVGLTVPDRFVFGFGMDAGGAWRNLPAIYAMKEEA